MFGRIMVTDRLDKDIRLLPLCKKTLSSMTCSRNLNEGKLSLDSLRLRKSESLT